MKTLFLTVALAAFFYASPAYAELKEMPLEGDIIHPCGGTGLELRSITQYFQHRWKSRYRDLDDSAVKAWVAYHNAEDEDIILVRVFESYMQPEIAVVSAKEFVNYLNDKPLVQLMCIVKLNNRLSLEYSPDKLEAILKGNGTDI
jgi:hypothetical protein